MVRALDVYEPFSGGMARVFVQADGINPGSPYIYIGRLQLGEASQSQGETTPVPVPSSVQRNKWDIVDQLPGAPELGTVGFTQRMDLGLRDFWWDLRKRNCLFNMQVVLGTCERPDDFTKGTARLLFDRNRLTNFTVPTMNPLDGGDNAAGDLTGELTFQNLVPLRQIRLTQRAGTEVATEIVAGLFAGVASCGDCGPASDGCEKAYFLALPEALGKAEVIYTLDGFGSFVVSTVSSMAADAVPTAMVAIGEQLVVFDETGESHHVISFEDLNELIDGWSEISEGYVATFGPRAAFSLGVAQTFVAGADGYVYLIEDPMAGVQVVADGTATTEDLNAIHGAGQTIVAVGAAGTVLVSNDGGEGFGTITGPAVANLTAVWVFNKYVWAVGTGAGELYYTLDGGLSWSRGAVPGSLTSITDIKFDVDESGQSVGYLTGANATGTRVYRTFDGGNTWQSTAPAITQVTGPTVYNGVAVCGANAVAAFGVGAASDGALAVGM